MEKTRGSWVRGAVVLGLSGTMMAAALMSPALAVRLATTSYVKAKVNQAIGAFRTEAQNAFIEDGLQYVRGNTFTLTPGNFVQMSVACPSGTKVTGGGASVGNLSTDDAELEASYPSHSGSTAAGTTGWTVSVDNESSNAFNTNVYAICARSSGAASYAEGGAPAKTNVITGKL